LKEKSDEVLQGLLKKLSGLRVSLVELAEACGDLKDPEVMKLSEEIDQLVVRITALEGGAAPDCQLDECGK
jgi:hypothetical protein